MLDFLLASREPGKLLHAFATFLPRHTQLIELLEVQPKLWADAKPVAKTQRCVRRDAALAIDDSSDPVYRHVNLRRQLRCGNVEFPQLFGKMLAGMNRGARYGMPHLVVIHDLDIDRAGRSFGPFNANPPLVIDAGAATSSETLLNPLIGAVSLTCDRATSDLGLAIDNAQQCAHGAVEFASPLLVGLHRPRRNPEKALELLSRGCNL